MSHYQNQYQPQNPDPTLIIEGCAIATVNAAGTEYASGYVVVSGGVITAVGAGRAPRPAIVNPGTPAPRVIDGSDCLLTPGLVNTHHHLYQWIFAAWRRTRPSSNG